MAPEKFEQDVENGGIHEVDALQNPLLHRKKAVVNVSGGESDEVDEENGSMGMVLFSTFVAVCGSFEFGSCVSIAKL